MGKALKLAGNNILDNNVRPIEIGGLITSIETASFGNGAKVNGDLEISGKLILNDFVAITASDEISTSKINSDAGLSFDAGFNNTITFTNQISSTSPGTFYGLRLDVDKTKTAISDNTLYGLEVDVNNTLATAGTNSTLGILTTVTASHAADGGRMHVTGHKLDLDGGTNGTGATTQGLWIDIAGFDADQPVGILLDIQDDSLYDIKNMSSANNFNFFGIKTIANGATTLSTVDSAGTVAGITIDADGPVDINSATGRNITIDSANEIRLEAATKTIFDTPFMMEETGSALSDDAGKGQVWIKDDAPNTLYYTGDTGVDIQITGATNNALNFYQWIPIFFNERTTSRTYFRNADDAYNAWEWDSYDAEDDTVIGNTITITAHNYLGGFIVPEDCILLGARWKVYQSYNTSGNTLFQLWTGTTGTATLRTSNDITANRNQVSEDTSAITQSLSAGDYVTPGFQYISGTSTTWWGGVTLKFRKV